MIPDHLLEQAERLAGAGTGRPRQTDLRRAVSTAYYALFHLLTQAAARRLTSTPELRSWIARAYNHKSMKDVSAEIARGQAPQLVREFVPVVPDDLQVVAQALVDLQQARHQADYDTRPTHGFTRESAGALIQQAGEAFAAWNRVRNDAAAEVYLLAMLLKARS